MTTDLDNDLKDGFESVRDDQEEILWSDKPKFFPFVASGLTAVFGLAIFVITSYCMFKMANNAGIDDKSFYLFTAIPLVVFALGFLQRIFSYSNTSYALTNRRVMIRTGFIGTDFKSIDFDKISDIEVTVNLIERAFNVGTIKFFSGRTKLDDGFTSKLYDQWDSIPNVYEIFKKVKQVSTDIKTDFHYPNAYRPDINPGYNTKYDRK